MLNNSGESGHPCVIPDLRGNVFHFSPLRIMFTIGLPVFSGGSVGKGSACNSGDLGSIPGLGRPPREGNGNPLQYSCLENPKDGGAWCPWGHKESDMTERFHYHIYGL